MSNPYDPSGPSDPAQQPPGQPYPNQPYPNQPYPNQPYPNQGNNPYAAQPYPNQPPYPGGYAPYGSPGHQQRSTDVLSIVGLVLAFTGCLSFVGAILGIIGITRTGPAKAKGRWAAVTALVVGVLVTLAAIALVVVAVVSVAGVITPSNAEAGQCADIETDAGDLSFTESDCTVAHDAEFVYVAEIGDLDLTGALVPEDICRSQMSPDATAKVDAVPDVRWSIATENPISPQPDDTFICYVEIPGGGLDAPILG